MTKKEIIWREILHRTIQKRQNTFTQKEMAEKLNVSLSTVYNALSPLRKLGAIKVSGRGFKIIDIEKMLYLWGTFRNIGKNIIYSTYTDKPVHEIEASMPPDVVFGAFSAYVKKYGDTPADYDLVCVYSDKENLSKIKERFPKRKGRENLLVLEADPLLKEFGSVTPNSQTFVDLWNIDKWYAKDFSNALKEKILND